MLQVVKLICHKAPGRVDGWFNIIRQVTATCPPMRAHWRRQFQFQFQYLCISRMHLFYDIQWKRIRGIPFILKSHNNTDTTNQNAYFKPSSG